MNIIEVMKQALEHIEYTASIGTSMSRDTCHYLMDESRKEATNLRNLITELEKAEPYEIVYEYAELGGIHRSLRHYQRNGSYPIRAVKVFTHPSEDKKDAERYRWLRDASGDFAEDEAFRIMADCRPEEWDTAIDAAMKGTK